MSDLECDLITSRAELNELEPEWNRLLQRSTANNVFLTWEWVSSWWQWLSGDREPWVLAMRQPSTGKLLGLAPLAQQQYTTRRGLRYRVLTFIGSYRAAPDHLDFIIDAEYELIVAPALMKRLMSQGRPYIFSFDSLAADSTPARLLRNKSGYRQMSEEICPYIELPADWDSYWLMVSKSLRKNTEYSARRLERLHPGEVSYSQVATERELETALATLFRLHTEVRQAHNEIGAFADNRMRHFHRRVASLFLSNGWLRFYRLGVGGEDIALLYCYYYNTVLSHYQSGYNVEWHKYSPGNLIIAHAIKQAIEECATEFDFLRGAEPYKFRWTDQERKDLCVEFSQSILRKVHLLYLSAGRRVRFIRAMMTTRGSK